MQELLKNKKIKIALIIVLGFILFNVLGTIIFGLFVVGGFYFAYQYFSNKNSKFPIVVANDESDEIKSNMTDFEKIVQSGIDEITDIQKNRKNN